MENSLEKSIDQFYDANIKPNSWFYFGTPPAKTTTEKLQLFFEKYKDLQNTEIDKCRAVKMGCDKKNSELREENKKLRKENEVLRKENEEGLLTEQQEKDLEEFEHLKIKINEVYQKYYKDQGEDINFVNKFFRFFIKTEDSSSSEKLDKLNEAFDEVIKYCNERVKLIANDIEKIFKSADLADALDEYYEVEERKTGNLNFIEDYRTKKIVDLIERLEQSNKTLINQVNEVKEIENNLIKENEKAVHAYFDNIFNIRGNLELNTGLGSEERDYANPYEQYLPEINERIKILVENSKEINEVKSIINSAYASEENRKDFLSGIINALKQETYPDTELKISKKLKIFYRAYDALSNDKIEICEEIKQQNKEIKERFENYHLNWIKENAGILNKNVTVIKNLVSYSALSSIKLNIDLKNDSTLNNAIALYEKGVDTEINLNKILVYLENNAKQQNTFLQKSFDNLKNSNNTLNIFNKQESTAAIKNANEIIDFVNKKIKSYEAFLGIVITQMMIRGDITKPEIDSYLSDNYNKNKSAIEKMLDFLESKILDMCDKLTGAEIKQQNIQEQSKIYISGLYKRYTAEEKYIQEIIANVNDENLKKILEPLIEKNSKALDEVTKWQEKEKIIVRNGIILLENLQKEKNSLEAEQAEYIEQTDNCDILKQQLISVQDEIKYQQDILQTLTQDRQAVMQKYKVVAEKLKSIITDEESQADIRKEIYDATVKIDLSQEETKKTINKLQDEKKMCEDKIEAMTAEAAQKTEENEIKFRQIAENSEKEIKQKTEENEKKIKQKKEENEKKASAEPNVVEAVQTVFEKYYGKLPNYAEKLNTQIKSRMSSIGQMLSLRAESPKAEVRVPKVLKAPIVSPEVDVKKQLKQSISNIRQSTALWLSR
jgi:hypothetical protein